MSFVRAELGARDENVDLLKYRMEDETIELKSALSLEIDVDIVETISNLTAKQASFEASLRVIGQISQLSLLDYI
ncbi:MAG: flagellin [Pirellulales bacterium]